MILIPQQKYLKAIKEGKPNEKESRKNEEELEEVLRKKKMKRGIVNWSKKFEIH